MFSFSLVGVVRHWHNTNEIWVPSGPLWLNLFRFWILVMKHDVFTLWKYFWFDIMGQKLHSSHQTKNFNWQHTGQTVSKRGHMSTVLPACQMNLSTLPQYISTFNHLQAMSPFKSQFLLPTCFTMSIIGNQIFLRKENQWDKMIWMWNHSWKLCVSGLVFTELLTDWLYTCFFEEISY